MARKQSSSGNRFPKVEAVPVESLGFYTIGPDHTYWGARDVEVAFDGDAIDGFVRIIAPPTASDADVENLRRWAAAQPAVYDVQTRRAAPAQIVVEQSKVKFESASIREVVETMVREANTRDREALAALVQTTMAAVKL